MSENQLLSKSKTIKEALRITERYSPEILSKQISLRNDSQKAKTKLGNSLSDSLLPSNALSKLKLKEEMQKIKCSPERDYRLGISKIIQMAKESIDSSISTNTELTPKRTDKSGFNRAIDTSSHSTLAEATRTSPKNLQLQPLFSVPNFISRAGFKTRSGYINGKMKLYKQTGVIIKPSLQNIKGQYLFAMCSSHGSLGHRICDAVKEQYASTLELLMPFEPSDEQIGKALQLSSDRINTMLNGLQIDLNFSGCSFLSLVISGSNCICANLGNCRGIIASEGTVWQAVPLSKDHVLSNPRERERVLITNGRIETEYDKDGNYGVEKLYMGNEKYPGLEVTRSFGDKIGRFVGVIGIPEVFSTELTEQDKFIVIANSTVWKAITNIEAVCIARVGWESNNTEQSCEDIANEVSRRSTQNGAEVDDISVIVIYINKVS